MVRFVSGKVTVVGPERWSVRTGGGTVATRKQLPLKLAWAMSIHKSQVHLPLVCVHAHTYRLPWCVHVFVAMRIPQLIVSIVHVVS